MKEMSKLEDQELEAVSGGITQDQALMEALKHAGFKRNEITGLKKIKRGHENGVRVYEIEFKKDGWEYEYDIDMATGQIVNFDRDFDD